MMSRGRRERQGRRVQVHIGEGVPEQCAHSMRSRYDYRKPSRNYFLYIENALRPFASLLPSKVTPSAVPIVYPFPSLSRRSFLDHATTFFHPLGRAFNQA